MTMVNSGLKGLNLFLKKIRPYKSLKMKVRYLKRSLSGSSRVSRTEDQPIGVFKINHIYIYI